MKIMIRNKEDLRNQRNAFLKQISIMGIFAWETTEIQTEKQGKKKTQMLRSKEGSIERVEICLEKGEENGGYVWKSKDGIIRGAKRVRCAPNHVQWELESWNGIMHPHTCSEKMRMGVEI